MSHRLCDVARRFTYPMPLYISDDLQVFGAACTFAEVLTMYRCAVERAGVTQLVPRIVAHGLVVRGYSNVWVEWDHLSATGRCLRTSQVRYVMSHQSPGAWPRIELVDYCATAFPEVPAQFTRMATA